jgi:hypothetical protein
MKSQTNFPWWCIRIFTILLFLLSGCGAAPAARNGSGLSEQAIATLNSLEQIDPYPLYVMHYAGAYATAALPEGFAKTAAPGWACSLFAALGDPDAMQYGRNFDWEFSPALLLFTDAPDAYASVSMVNIGFLTQAALDAGHLADLPLAGRQVLLSAPLLPIDGMNEYGLVISMAAVEGSIAGRDPAKPTIGSLRIMREVLDHARTTGEALGIISGYNIDFTGGPPVHYLVADRNGKAVLVEFHQGELVAIPNDVPWHLATNHLRCIAKGDGGCSRYQILRERLAGTNGRLDPQSARSLLSEVSQPNTVWSIVYGMTSGEIDISMQRHYQKVYSFRLDLLDER